MELNNSRKSGCYKQFWLKMSIDGGQMEINSQSMEHHKERKSIWCLVQKFSMENFQQKFAISRILKSMEEGSDLWLLQKNVHYLPLLSITTPKKEYQIPCTPEDVHSKSKTWILHPVESMVLTRNALCIINSNVAKSIQRGINIIKYITKSLSRH